MSLLQCCLVAVFITTVSTAAVDVEKTVKQVQSILQANSLLPRLSREEIISLLNDIRAEDSKSTSSSNENSKEVTSTTPFNTIENEVTPVTENANIKNNVIDSNENRHIKNNVIHTNENQVSSSREEKTTKKPSVTLVLPYTPRDGSSLQELYTRPPRVEIVPVTDATPKTANKYSSKIQKTLTENAKLAEKKKMDFPAELQAFLDAHGLKGTPGQDHFLLPLEGFKPLPPAKIVDGTVQLPENILLTYDLIPNNEKLNDDGVAKSPNNFLYEPLRPEIPFELDTSSSEKKETTYPLDIPKRIPKSTGNQSPSYEPIDYEAVKVIPLNKGVNPVEEVKDSAESEQSKRQTNDSSTTEAPSTTTEEAKSVSSESPAADSVPADSDKGASIADLEDSFGGAAPEEPGGSDLPPPKKNGFYWMLDWNSFLEVGDDEEKKVNIRFEPKLGDPQMFLPVTVP